VFVSLAWVFFRAKDFQFAGTMMLSLFGVISSGAAVLATTEMAKVAAADAGLLIAHWTLRNTSLEVAVQRMMPAAIVAIWTAMAFAVVLTQGGGNAFIYFQF
jgi:alginate O-acetyltransferase complex protein AlgI